MTAHDQVGLGSLVDDVLTRAEIRHTKDETKFWPAVLSRLRPRPDEAALAGDSYERDSGRSSYTSGLGH